MSIGNVHGVSVLDALDNVSASQWILYGVEDRQVDPQVTEIVKRAAGEVRPSYRAVMSVTPEISMTTTDVKTALDNIGRTGLGVKSGNAIETLNFYFTDYAEHSDRTAGAAHFRVAVKECLGVPQQLSWSQEGDAQLTLLFATTYDGTNEPFLFQDSVSLPASLFVDELFTGGKAVVNNVELNGVVGMTYDFGINIFRSGAAGSARPLFVAIQNAQEQIELQTLEIPSLSTFGLLGTTATNASICYLTKMDELGDRVANGTAEHISLTLAANQHMITCGPYGGGPDSNAQGVVRLMPIEDSSAGVAINTATTIT